MIKELAGDATVTDATTKTLIAHVVNNAGYWGAGFVKALDQLSPLPRSTYLSWFGLYEKPVGTKVPQMLGYCKVVPMHTTLAVAHLCAQEGISRTGARVVQYAALGTCLIKLNRYAAVNAYELIQMPRIGAGLGGGDWDVIKGLIAQHLIDVPMKVFTLEAAS